MAEVIILPELAHKLNDLVFVLYKKEYFGFMDSALAYVDAIYDFIYTIPQKIPKTAKQSTYGKFFCRFQPNPNTTWYVFFDMENDVYLVQNIINNHEPDYARIMVGLE